MSTQKTAFLKMFIATIGMGLIGLNFIWAIPPESGQEGIAAPQDLTNLGLEDLMKIKVDTVYAASKHTQLVTEAPASVTVVTAEQRRRYGYRTLGDVLRSVGGFYVSYDRYQYYVGVRGFSRPGDYNCRVLLLLDGHRINDNIYDSASIGTDFLLDMSLIDRIEIIRGPSSSLYGTSAFLGVINIISKKGEQIKGGQATIEAGSLETVKGAFAYGGRFKSGLDLVLNGSGYHSEGEKSLYFPKFDSPETNNGIAANADQDQYEHLFGNIPSGKKDWLQLHGVLSLMSHQMWLGTNEGIWIFLTPNRVRTRRPPFLPGFIWTSMPIRGTISKIQSKKTVPL